MYNYSSATYTVTLTTNSTSYITSVTTPTTDQEEIIDLAIERIKEEDGFDLSNAFAAGPARAAIITDTAGSNPSSLLAKNVKNETNTPRK